MGRFVFDPRSGLMLPGRSVPLRGRPLMMGAPQQMLMSYGAAAPGASYLLDTYSGAIFGGSFARKLKSTATAAYQVKKVSAGTTQDIGFSGGDADSAAAVSFVGGGANDGTVQRLYNQAGSDYLEPFGGSSPIIVNSGAVITGSNSKPAASFPGTPMRSSSSSWATTNGVTGNLVASVFIVARKTTNTSGYLFNWGNTGFALGNFGIYDDGSSALVAFAGGNSKTLSSFTNNTWYQTTVIKTAGNISTTCNAWRNGSSISSGGPAATPNNLGDYLNLGQWGGGFPLSGAIQEFIVFAGDKTSDRAAIESDIRTFYGL